jgi:lysophospholipase L1-like esterase
MNQGLYRLRTAANAVLLTTLCLPALSQTRTYIALGDSVAVGTGSTMLQGYVGRYDAWLGTVYGTAPTAVDLGVGGETSKSILGAQLTNFETTAASEIAAGDTITAISVSIGANDLGDYLNTAITSGETEAQIEAGIPGVLSTVQTNYATLLTAVRKEVPNCDLILNSYWNYPWYGPTFYQITDYADQLSNQTLATLATQFNGRWVDNYAAFLGNETVYLHQNQEHPNDTGYDVIAVDMRNVPAPNALVTALIGAATLFGGRRRLRR